MAKIADKLKGKSTKLARAGEVLKGTPPPLPRAGRFLEIDPKRIKPNPDQPRRDFEPVAMKELTDSVAEHGVLENLIVRMDGDQVILIAGERRLRAALGAELATVPCVMSDGDPAILALIENLHRQDLTPLEESAHYAKLIKQKGYTLDDLARITRKSKSTISETLKIVDLPSDVLATVSEPGKYPKRLLVELAKEPDPDKVRAIVDQVGAGKAAPDKVRSQLRQERAEAKAKPQPRKESRKTEAPKPSDKAAAEAARLAASLAALDLPSLNYRQRGVLREALKALAKATDPIFHHLKQAAINDRDKLTPEDRARLLAEIRGGKSMESVRRALGQQGKKMCAVEFSHQHALALQEERARKAEGGE